MNCWAARPMSCAKTSPCWKGRPTPSILDDYLKGSQTPVFFGSAINNFGVREMLDAFVEMAPAPLPRPTITRMVSPDEEAFLRFRLQDPGEHGPGAPRPHRLLAHLLGHVYRGA